MRSPDFQTRLDEGLRLFRAGRFFEAHEAWEAGWLKSRGAEKQLLQVLVLWAAAFHHGRNDNRVGAVTLIKRALEKLAAPAIARPPFDLDLLREALTHSWEGLSREGALELTPPAWEPSPGRLAVVLQRDDE